MMKKILVTTDKGKGIPPTITPETSSKTRSVPLLTILIRNTTTTLLPLLHSIDHTLRYLQTSVPLGQAIISLRGIPVKAIRQKARTETMTDTPTGA